MHISPLNFDHKTGKFGDYSGKNDKDLLKVSEVNKLLIFQIAKFKNSNFDISNIHVDELNLPSESFVAFFTAAGLMARPIRQLSNLNAVIQRGLAAAEDIFNTIDSYPEDHESGI